MVCSCLALDLPEHYLAAEVLDLPECVAAGALDLPMRVAAGALDFPVCVAAVVGVETINLDADHDCVELHVCRDDAEGYAHRW